MSDTHYIQRRFDPETSPEETELIQIYNDHFKRHNITFDQFLNTRLYPNSATTVAILEAVFSDLPQSAIEVPGQAKQERSEV